MIVVDRIEGTVAVLEIGGKTVDVPLSELPAGVKEGDRLSFRVEPADTSAAEDRLARLKSKTKQGPGSFEL